MSAKTTSSAKRLVSRSVRSKGLLERTPLGGFIKKGKNVGNSIMGMGCGFLFLLLGFFLIYGSFKWVKRYSAVVESLPLEDASSVSADAGLVKVQGSPDLIKSLEFEYKIDSSSPCDSEDCGGQEGQLSQSVEDLLYYSAEYERYEQYKEVETEKKVTDKGGQEVTEEYEVTEIKEDWKEKGGEEKWADFKVGDIQVVGKDVRNKVQVTSEVIDNVILPAKYDKGDYLVKGHEDEASGEVGQSRLVLKTARADSDLIIVGELQSGKIESGEPFIITDMGDDELVESLKSDEKTSRLLIRIGAWVTFTIGFVLVLGPILALADFIPVVGGAARFLAFVMAAILSAIIVVTGVLIIQFWWVLLILLVGLGIGGFLLIKKKNQEQTTEDQETKFQDGQIK
jgi:hypothetical protein